MLEDSPVNPANDYAVSKLAMEYMAKTYMGRLPVVITRPFNYTGVGQNERFLIPKIISHVKRKEAGISSAIDIQRDFSDVDIARYYMRTAEICLLGKTINFCSGKACSLMQILDQAQKIAGHSLEIRSLQEFKRDNEVHTLSGDNTELRDSWRRNQSSNTRYSRLDDSLCYLIQLFQQASREVASTSIPSTQNPDPSSQALIQTAATDLGPLSEIKTTVQLQQPLRNCQVGQNQFCRDICLQPPKTI